MTLLTTNVAATLEAAHAIIDEALAAYPIQRVYALFSGGHDSLCATHVAAQHPSFSGVVHLNTGTGLPATRLFVFQTCAAHGWPLTELAPTWRYEQLIIRYGFPGPAAHTFMYRYLKERQLRRFCAGIKADLKKEGIPDRDAVIALISGERLSESARRMGHAEPIHKDGAHIWIAPIINWDGGDITRYLHTQALQRSPVVDRLHMSGECYCGSYLTPDERQRVRDFYPAQEARFTQWEQLVDLAATLPGYSIPRRRRVWGSSGGIPKAQGDFLPLCHHCHEAPL